MPHLESSGILAPRGHGGMTRGSYFGEMNYSRLVRLVSDRDLYSARYSASCEPVIRCCSFMQFCCVSLLSLVTVMTPWMLSAAELVIMIVLYLSVAPEAVESLEDGPTTHEINKNFEDLLILSVIRVTLLSISYAFAFSRYKPYYITAWLTSSVLIPYAIVKAAVTESRPVGPSVSLITTIIVFSVVHLIVAHATTKRLQRRFNMGIGGFDSPWDEEDWVMSGALDSGDTTEAIQELFLSADDDVPRDVLTDLDSKFVDCGGLSVHYKEEVPQEESTVDPTFAVLLIHGFGGVFAWRHVMKPLAEICRCRVVAFDRPAFGLTARPRCVNSSESPYALQSQQSLVLELCEKLGIEKAVIVAHSDGCLLALMAGSAVNQTDISITQSIKIGPVFKREMTRSFMRLPIRRVASEDISRTEVDLSVVHESETEGNESESSTMIDALIDEPKSRRLSLVAMVFLHPDLSNDDGPNFTNLLRQSKIARKVLRPLMRSDIGEVSNRRAWYDTTKLTKEILELYKLPLRIRGWDSALVTYTKERKAVTNEMTSLFMRRVIGIPLMVVTGEKDRIVPPERAKAIADAIHADHRSVLANCGHLSHEETPELLLETLAAYIRHICEQHYEV